jgi:hypothetical protein
MIEYKCYNIKAARDDSRAAPARAVGSKCHFNQSTVCPLAGKYADQGQSSMARRGSTTRPLGRRVKVSNLICKCADMYLKIEGLFNVIIRYVIFFLHMVDLKYSEIHYITFSYLNILAFLVPSIFVRMVLYENKNFDLLTPAFTVILLGRFLLTIIF